MHFFAEHISIYVLIAIAFGTALIPTIAVFLSWKHSSKKIYEVHQMVNSRLEAALASIETLKDEIRALKANQK